MAEGDRTDGGDVLAGKRPGFRVFVSYSHEDEALVERLVQILEDAGLTVLCDRSINVGMPFTDAIKSLITHAHLFMPLITKAARKRPWVHQEIGYAMARNIPVLPVVVARAGLPGEMISQLQAIVVKRKLSDLPERLAAANLEALVLPRPALPQDMVKVAYWPEERTEWMAQYADRVVDMGHYGMLRQKGAFSSFCLPDGHVSDRIWRDRDGEGVRSDHYHHLQRAERQALERHARQAGCRLIIDPTLDLRTRGPCVTSTRLKTLLEFVESMPDELLQIATSHRALSGSLTILGDWFVAESVTPRPGGYLQTVFDWHAPTALRRARQFDLEFEEICAQKGIAPQDSRGAAITEIRKCIEAATPEEPCDGRT